MGLKKLLRKRGNSAQVKYRISDAENRIDHQMSAIDAYDEHYGTFDSIAEHSSPEGLKAAISEQFSPLDKTVSGFKANEVKAASYLNKEKNLSSLLGKGSKGFRLGDRLIHPHIKAGLKAMDMGMAPETLAEIGKAGKLGELAKLLEVL